MRCFVAVDLPENVKSRVHHAFEPLRQLGLIRGRFVDRDNLHLTLRFLGELGEEEITSVQKVLENVNHSKFDAEISDIGAFPSESYIKVLWVGVNAKQDKLKELHSSVENNLDKLGIGKSEKTERGFSNHITVARINTIVKSKSNKNLFIEKLKNLKVPREKFEVDKISLIKSELTKQGPIYRTLKEFKLK